MRYQLAIISLAIVVGCVPFFDAEPSGTLVEFEVNACGGTEFLMFAGEEAVPLEACGVCPGEGHLACNGVDALRCVGAPEPNACGGCLPLPGEPYDDCGACDGDPSGYYVCDGENSLECINAAGYNACGGCSLLEGEPGQPCDSTDGTATWTCDPGDSVSCNSGGLNLCGGTQDLEFEGITAPAPGMECEGECSPGGVLRCDGGNDVICNEAGVLNVCDGCGPVQGEFGEDCGRCGEYTCSDTQMFCVDPEPNQCGGCGELSRLVGEDCEGGIVICNGDDDVICISRTGESNACGGLGQLPNVPGQLCGTCDSGIWVCDGTGSVVCEGDLGNDAFNDCGGCDELAAGEEDPCGQCGTGEFVCDPEDPNSLTCVGAAEGEDAQNACGGCAFLWGAPGDSCGECFTWQCSSSEDAVACVWAGDQPGGCPELDCTLCEQNHRECDEAGECGNCIDGYELVGDVCQPIEVECSDEVPCELGERRAVPGSVCSRTNATGCESSGMQPARAREQQCQDGVCVDTGSFVPAGSVDCFVGTDGLNCVLPTSAEGICVSEACRPLTVVISADTVSNGQATTGSCPNGYFLTAGGCLTDRRGIRASGPREFVDGEYGVLANARRWSCESAESTDNSVTAFALCAHSSLANSHSYLSDGRLDATGRSPTCELAGLLVGGACDGDFGVHGMAVQGLVDMSGTAAVAPDDIWHCETQSADRNTASAASCMLTDGVLHYVRSVRTRYEVQCDEGILVGGGCSEPPTDILSGSYPQIGADGSLEWRCQSAEGAGNGVAFATCLVMPTPGD